MSFSADIKENLSKISHFDEDILRAELIGYLLSGNANSEGKYFEFVTENEFNIEHFYKILFALKIEYEPEMRGKLYLAQMNPKAVERILQNYQDLEGDIRKNIVKGAFLGAGSVNNPEKNYHLEMIFNQEEYANYVGQICEEFDVKVKKIEINNKYQLYLKESEEISKFLALIGASRAVLKFEDVRVMKEMKNHVNRKVNCETANLNKTIEAALKQIDDIQLIKKRKKFEDLPKELKDVANLRLENPDLSLQDLSELMNPPIRKIRRKSSIEKNSCIGRRVKIKEKKCKAYGMYIHIPFCQKKCRYCDFISFGECDNEIKEKYVKSLVEEIGHFETKKKISTIYIGGGTPSILPVEAIEKILERIRNQFAVLENAEITIEVNPGTVDLEKLRKYKKMGVNRLSVGLQSTHNRCLNLLGRIHSYEVFIKTYEEARTVGFDNINVDLMLGFPTQSLEELRESLQKIVALKPEHVSIYSLILEEGTELEKLVLEKKLEMIPEELERKMYWESKKILEENGFLQYEISNFAKKGMESKHNLACWNQEEYIGFGVSSHSYESKRRFSKINCLEEYIENIENKNFDKNIILQEKEQTFEEQAKEYMMLGLRKIEGVSISKFEQKFQIHPLFYFRFEISKLEEKGLLEVDLDEIRLTKKGLDFANLVFEEFV